MQTLMDLEIDDNQSIKICVEDYENKINLYQEPTPEIHKFDEVSIFYKCGNKRYRLFFDILQEAFCSLKSALSEALEGKLMLKEGLIVGNVGKAYNKLLMEEKVDEACEFLASVWLFKDVHTFIYNDKKGAYIEISRRLFDIDNDVDEDVISSLILTDYQPIALIPLERSKMMTWYEQCKTLMNKLGIDYC